MRPNPGDEYTITELNEVKWSFDGTPQVNFNCLSTWVYTLNICGDNLAAEAASGGYIINIKMKTKLTGKIVHTCFDELMCLS